VAEKEEKPIRMLIALVSTGPLKLFIDERLFSSSYFPFVRRFLCLSHPPFLAHSFSCLLIIILSFIFFALYITFVTLI
jgi:hypothetical protein